MIKYYLARLVLWATDVVQARVKRDNQLVTNVVTNYSYILNDLLKPKVTSNVIEEDDNDW
tara:strand:+ start:765 stop:944 length:180 start_codon:yes stop_codon:yes gene_type:complete